MKMIKNDNVSSDGTIVVVLSEGEVRQFWLVQEKIDDGLSYNQSLYGRIEEGMRLLKPTKSGEIELI